MKYAINTNFLPIFTGLYENIWEVSEIDDNGNELEVSYNLNQFFKSIIKSYKNNCINIKNELNTYTNFIKDINFTYNRYSPTEYNFSTDSFEIKLNFDYKAMLKYVKTLENDKKFTDYLIENYQSRDGFISFTPCHYIDILESFKTKDSDFLYSLGAILKYIYDPELLQNIEYMVYESWQGNGYNNLNYKIKL